MRKRYYFVLADGNNKISGHAYTLTGVRHIFKKVTNASSCSVYKNSKNGYFGTPFVVFYK